eukprot:NODE_1470_length_940_cov_109.013468_g1139_i0.p1 GENE.NODE_1470_length_940_cov_109.013468_g1139_i0~~NODE_1470_length_940_cov_109.013468_g1139_i0.p1  ORF type:complete len:215 (+),score=27.78 NODE_1470_length_940_cov_109.013468_g1139_i0:60-704(+)
MAFDGFTQRPSEPPRAQVPWVTTKRCFEGATASHVTPHKPNARCGYSEYSENYPHKSVDREAPVVGTEGVAKTEAIKTYAGSRLTKGVPLSPAMDTAAVSDQTTRGHMRKPFPATAKTTHMPLSPSTAMDKKTTRGCLEDGNRAHMRRPFPNSTNSGNVPLSPSAAMPAAGKRQIHTPKESPISSPSNLGRAQAIRTYPLLENHHNYSNIVFGY